ncbi:MAG TPA: GAF domain-containing protein [bacterium]
MANILVVDDDELICSKLSEIIGSMDHSSITAQSGIEALEILKSNHFDIILLDIVMPNLHGIDVLRRIREQNRNLPVIMLVSEKERFLSSKAFTLGALDFLKKPLDELEVQKVLNKIFELKNKAKDESFGRIIALEYGAKQFAEITKGTISIDSLFENTEMLQHMVNLIAEVMGVEKVSLMWINRATNEMRVAVAYGYNASEAKKDIKKVGEGISGWVAEKEEPLLVKDFSKDRRFKESDFSSKYKSNSFISVPLKLFDMTIGVISLNDKKNGAHFDEHDLAVLNMFSNQISLSLERSHIGSELKKYTGRLSLVNDSLRVLISEVDPHSTFVELLNLAYNVLGAEGIALYLKEDDGENFLLEVSITDDNITENKEILSQADSICEIVRKEGNIFYTETVVEEPRFNKEIDGMTGINVNSLILLPIKMKKYVVGILKVVNKRGELKFSPEDIEITESIGFAITIASKIAWLHNNLVKSIDKLALAETEIDVMKENIEKIE